MRGRPHRGLIVALVLTGSTASGAYLAYRSLLAGIEKYGATNPEPLPAVNLSPGNQKKLHARMAAFVTALETHRASSPLVLTADEINALIAVAPGLGGKVWVEIESNQVRARFCLPLEDLGFPQLRGSFLNGTSVLTLSIVEGGLVVSPEAIDVRSGRLPEAVMARLRKANLARLAFRDPRVARSLRRLGGIEVRQGTVEIKAR
ncbi:MAG TPA: hypothetical protein VGH33_08650 [Isosphaeraceae bacterium]